MIEKITDRFLWLQPFHTLIRPPALLALLTSLTQSPSLLSSRFSFAKTFLSHLSRVDLVTIRKRVPISNPFYSNESLLKRIGQRSLANDEQRTKLGSARLACLLCCLSCKGRLTELSRSRNDEQSGSYKSSFIPLRLRKKAQTTRDRRNPS